MQHLSPPCDIMKSAIQLEATKTTHTDHWVKAAQAGDQRAFSELYREHAKGLYNTVYRMVQHSGEAEDLLQDSFVSAFQQIGQFEQRASFVAWVKRIAIHKAISHLRKRKNMRFAEWDDQQTPLTEESVDEDLFVWQVDSIKKAIAQLPDGYRTVVNLYLIEGIPQEEIGEILGISHNTVRTQYHRAKQKLIKEIQALAIP